MEIMEVTLRDGSYAVNFQFSTIDTEVIGHELEDLGFRYIEIGHGMGLNASSYKNGLALHSDREYLAAAGKGIRTACYGMFCIPGTARLEDIDMAYEMGMRFIRIGTNVDRITDSEDYIKRAKERGLKVFSNFMKSYILTPVEFAERVKMSEAYGADAIYLVDSAGNMLPEDIERYFLEIRKVSNIPLGFHGHDNLGMAVANSLKAAELGFSYIDTSLQGMGRSAGNAATELFSICAMKRGYIDKLDYRRMLKFSKKMISPLIQQRGIEPIDTVCGVAGFHSSYLASIHRQAALNGVDPLELIEEYSKIDQVNMDEDRLAKLASELRKNQESNFGINFINYYGNEQMI